MSLVRFYRSIPVGPLGWLTFRPLVPEIGSATITPYGQILLSIIPFALSLHPFSASKKLLVAEFLINEVGSPCALSVLSHFLPDPDSGNLSFRSCI